MDDWKAHKACSTETQALFFSSIEDDTDKAKAICSMCPVKSQCLNEALRLGSRAFGVWAGTDDDERKRIRRRRLKVAQRNRELAAT